MPVLDPQLEAWLDRAADAGRLRRLRPVSPAGTGPLSGPGAVDTPTARVRRHGRELVDFSSNDYLGLRTHPVVVERAAEWARRWGAGAGASRLVSGDLEAFHQVEARVARLKGADAALVFVSGFQANATVLPALLDARMLGAEPLVFTDRLIHASMHHGLAAAGVRQTRFRHNDLEHLASLLEAHADDPRPRFIVTETVFSMDGDRADVPGLVALAERHGAFLYLDEAHATGVLGEGGRGLGAGVAGRRGLVMGTFGKALGGFGAYVAGSARLRDYLVNRCAGFVFATGLPPAALGAADAALELLPDLDDARAAVAAHAERARRRLQAAGLDTGASTTHIVPVILGEEAHALRVGRALEARGFLTVPIRPPTVPPGSSRLRLAFSARHTTAEVDALVDALLEEASP